MTKKKEVKKFEKKVTDARSDPIPKPSMFPAARPPRGYMPSRPVPNSSLGVSMTLNEGSGGSRVESVLGVSPILATSCPTLCVSGRDSVASDRSDVIQVSLKNTENLFETFLSLTVQ